MSNLDDMRCEESAATLSKLFDDLREAISNETTWLVIMKYVYWPLELVITWMFNVSLLHNG